jgi:hypothetical protein
MTRRGSHGSGPSVTIRRREGARSDQTHTIVTQKITRPVIHTEKRVEFSGFFDGRFGLEIVLSSVGRWIGSESILTGGGKVFGGAAKYLNIPMLEVKGCTRGSCACVKLVSDGGKQFPAMKFGFRHHPSGHRPTRRLIEKALKPDYWLVARPSHGPRQQLRNVPLQIVVGGKADRVLHRPLFQPLVELRLGKGGVAGGRPPLCPAPAAGRVRAAAVLPEIDFEPGKSGSAAGGFPVNVRCSCEGLEAKGVMTLRRGN